jgi:hypothetical protein
MKTEIQDCPPDEIRSSVDVARRALALHASVAVSLGALREEVLAWLNENSLVSELSPFESQFLNDPEPSRRQIINVSWHSECLIMLLWALGLAELPRANKQCDTAMFLEIFPPYSEVEVADFLAKACLRPDEELIEMADRMLDLHWSARDAKINSKPASVPVDIEIIQERHRAINWVIGYDGVSWDEVTTDT